MQRLIQFFGAFTSSWADNFCVAYGLGRKEQIQREQQQDRVTGTAAWRVFVWRCSITCETTETELLCYSRWGVIDRLVGEYRHMEYRIVRHELFDQRQN